MVTRKPLPENAAIDPTAAPRMQDMRQELWSATDSDPGTDSVWEDAARRKHADDTAQAANGEPTEEVPDALRPGVGAKLAGLGGGEENVWTTVGAGAAEAGAQPQTAGLSHVPTVLRPGGQAREETNPFKRKMSQSNASSPGRGTPAVPADVPPMPPSDAFADLSMNDSSNNPWQPALVQQRTGPVIPPSLPKEQSQDPGQNVWAREAPPPASKAVAESPALISFPSETEPVWGDDDLRVKAASKAPAPAPAAAVDVEEDLLENRNAWDDLGTPAKGKGKEPAFQAPAGKGPMFLVPEGRDDDWNLIDHEPNTSHYLDVSGTGSKPDSGATEKTEKMSLAADMRPGSSGPPLPPRQSVEKAETYAIKKIGWFDGSTGNRLRETPILVQNANGPCPLVALVNALTLTTPPDLDTELYQVLRSREQVSLNLLLDAVFEELMSPRRTSPDAVLPDIIELHEFLRSLHTGMNVNPRFVPTPEHIRAFKRTSLVHIHPTERGDLIPGTFEETREMSLYATFNIPLIHGWLPQQSEPAYEAFARSAVSYEDAQNLLFREEELEDRLSNARGTLSEEEQQVYQDILTIKSFLSISATQLTPCGLAIITRAMKPGTVAILFRNDHFTTLYRHPDTLELLTLVTDAGYASHDEIVWESLVDVNGERAEFFSGDFRLVGGALTEQRRRSSAGEGPSSGQPGRINEQDWPTIDASIQDGGGWTTVQNRRGKSKTVELDTPAASAEADGMLNSPNHEQEDRDLALALQLQEEEDMRHQAELARRRRESLLSEQFIEQQARQQPNIPPRGGGRAGADTTGTGRTRSNIPNGDALTGPPRTSSNGAVPVSIRGRRTQEVRSLVSPHVGATAAPRRAPVHRPADEGVEDAPPSYEQAQHQPSYVPPPGHPSHPSSSPSVSRQSTGMSAQVSGVTGTAGEGSSTGSTGLTPGAGRMPSHVAIRRPVAQQNSKGDGRDCVVM